MSPPLPMGIAGVSPSLTPGEQCRARRHRLLEKRGTTSLTSHSVPLLPRGHSVGENLSNRELLGNEDGPVGVRLDLRMRRVWDLDVCIKTTTAILPSCSHLILLASTHIVHLIIFYSKLLCCVPGSPSTAKTFISTWPNFPST